MREFLTASYTKSSVFTSSKTGRTVSSSILLIGWISFCKAMIFNRFSESIIFVVPLAVISNKCYVVGKLF